MSFAAPIAAELRVALQQLHKLSPDRRDPEHYHVLKDEIRHRIDQCVLMLEGHYDIMAPEQRPAGGTRRKRSTVILDAKGNVVHVDFQSRRKIEPRRDRS